MLRGKKIVREAHATYKISPLTTDPDKLINSVFIPPAEDVHYKPERVRNLAQI